MTKPAAGRGSGAPPRARPGRRRGHPDTRSAILRAARRNFAERGFAGATIRRIAADAGVDPALVHHFFGTKNRLLLATVDVTVDPVPIVRTLAAAGTDGLGGRLVATVLGVWESADGPALAAALRTGLADPAVGRIVGEFVLVEIVGRLLRAIGCPPEEIRMRSALVVSQMLGVLVGRYLLRIPCLAGRAPAEIAAGVGPTVQAYLTAPVPAA